LTKRDPNIVSEDELFFKFSSGMKDIIGRDLITNEIIAIFELVKNSYDADAKNVFITIDQMHNKITIKDDGTGMSFDDIKDKWLFIAYSEKADQNEKVYAGSKGIGRFSADRLGEQLVLISKKNNSISKVLVDWTIFQTNHKDEFTSKKIGYQQLISYPSLDETPSGTILIIEKLRDSWNQTRVERIEKALSALINPINSNENFKISIKYISEKGQIIDIDVQNNIQEVLLQKTVSMDCIISEDEIHVKLIDSGKLIYDLKLENNTLLKNVHYLVFYLNEKAKHNFTRIMKVHNKDYGSIFVYKNNFRVLPYGDTNHDTFQLNLRKTQGTRRYLAHREILGWVSITDTENKFKEASSRDAGFINNQYVIALEQLYMKLVHRPLEDYVKLIKFGNLDIDELEMSKGINPVYKLVKRFINKKTVIIHQKLYTLPLRAKSIQEKLGLLNDPTISLPEKNVIQHNVSDIVTNLLSENKQISNVLEDMVKSNRELQRELSIKNNIILVAKPHRSEFLEHELNVISREIKEITAEVVGLLDEKNLEILKYSLVDYNKLADKLQVIKNLVLRINKDTTVDNSINIKEYISMYFDKIISRGRLKSVTVRFDDDIPIIQKLNLFNLGILIDNIVINAKEMNATTLDIYVDKSGMQFISDTPAIEYNPIEKIFELGVSSKGGLGMGLYIVKQIADEFAWTIEVANITDNLVLFYFKFGGGN